MTRKFKCISTDEIHRRSWAVNYTVGKIYDEGDSFKFGLGCEPSEYAYFLHDDSGSYKYVDRACFELIDDSV